jgi:hypothetical protein
MPPELRKSLQTNAEWVIRRILNPFSRLCRGFDRNTAEKSGT